MSGSATLTIDLAPILARVAAAEVAYERAESRMAAAAKELADARTLRDAILAFAVTDEVTDTPSVSEAIAASVESMPTLVRNAPSLAKYATKVAVMMMLDDDRDRVWELNELHSAMRDRGFEGTHNAVHVAISRMRAEDGPIQRVKQGHYKWGKEPRTIEAVATVNGSSVNGSHQEVFPGG